MRSSALAACVAVIGAASLPQTLAPRPLTLVNSAALVRALRVNGVIALRRGRAPRDAFPFLAPRAARLSVAGEAVHVFEYATAEAAAKESSGISPAGSPVGTNQITWMAPPRFYRKDRLIVLYVGTDLDLVRALEAVLGQPFAGRRASQ